MLGRTTPHPPAVAVPSSELGPVGRGHFLQKTEKWAPSPGCPPACRALSKPGEEVLLVNKAGCCVTLPINIYHSFLASFPKESDSDTSAT